MRWGMKVGESSTWVEFAWFPIRLTNGSWVWWEKVRFTVTCHMGYWHPYYKVLKESIAEQATEASDES